MQYNRPTKRELDTMTESELQDRLLYDPPHAQLYRDAIHKLRSENGGEEKPKRANESTPIAPDVREMVRSAFVPRVNEDEPPMVSLMPLANSLLTSGWDFIDPDPKGMNSSPEDVQNFLLDLSWRDKYYADMTPPGQRKWNTIIDAYGRWWRKKSAPL